MDSNFQKMNIKDIENLIKFVQKSGVAEVSLEQKDFKITIKTSHTASPHNGNGVTTVIPAIPVAQPAVHLPVAAPITTIPPAAMLHHPRRQLQHQKPQRRQNIPLSNPLR